MVIQSYTWGAGREVNFETLPALSEPAATGRLRKVVDPFGGCRGHSSEQWMYRWQ